MTRDKPRNLAASVRQRLMNIARGRSEDFQFVLTRYGVERLLYRLTQSPHAGTFVLKGAVLFQLWSGQMHRPTRDLDLLGQGEPSAERMGQVFRDLCHQGVQKDGLNFLSESVRAEQIQEDDEYQGIRLRLVARLGNARIPLQIDIGFGDAVTPAPEEIEYPKLLDFPAPSLLAYPRETVVAEKFQAMVMLGIANTRMKDFFDLWTLARQFAFQGPTLSQAIQATFLRRQTELPEQPPVAMTAEFYDDRTKRTQWQAFLRKGKLIESAIELAQVASILDGFLMPPTCALRAGQDFDSSWPAGGPWRSS